ncbi:MAG: GTP 3',8-cyclase MoaA [Actinomycetota bacterium]|nr:GTP 3',8-cyclase MoaA [Actinomycetota bacterium]
MRPATCICGRKWGHMPELIDSYKRKIDYLRVSITDRCNLRCVYCMPKEGIKPKPHSEILTYEEIELFAKCAVKVGISRIRLTGGEPLVRRGVVDLVHRLSQISDLKDMSLTTNGILLKDYAKALVDAGLKRINISLDSLEPEVYRRLTRGGDVRKALEGMNAALEVGLDPVKINVVVLRGLNENLKKFAELILEYPVHVRFIEYMPFNQELNYEDRFVSCAEMMEKLKNFGGLEEVSSPLGAGPARYYTFKGAQGTLGFISPVSGHFCSKCNRLRLTADGRLRTCLFSEEEINVKKVLREGSEQRIMELIREALINKPKDRMSIRKASLKRRMSQIGG